MEILALRSIVAYGNVLEPPALLGVLLCTEAPSCSRTAAHLGCKPLDSKFSYSESHLRIDSTTLIA